ncbi:MAG: hypothetical protein HWE10_08485 [Gammaproteobacteria bacterium]|nr:hypothetical protein [Gammaproteobacteria bacterium]
MKTLPIFVSIVDKPILVVGGGDVAQRKIQTALKAGAKVTVVSLEFCQPILDIQNENLHLLLQAYTPDLINDKWLVIAATDDNEVNDTVHKDALAQKVFVNVVDDPARCHFIFPAIIDRSPIVVAISSGGEAPVLARLWKEKFESLMPQWTGRLAALAGSYRQQVKSKIKDFTLRRHFWERFFRGDIAAKASQNDWQGVKQLIEQTLIDQNQLASSLFYVGTGDNQPDNLTLKALQTMQLADLIIHDAKVNSDIIDLTRKDSDKLLIDTTDEQQVAEHINKALSENKIVVRLVEGCPNTGRCSKQDNCPNTSPSVLQEISLTSAKDSATKIKGVCNGCKL